MAEKVTHPVIVEPETVANGQGQAPAPMTVSLQSDDKAIAYCIGGVLALIGAWFAFGIPLSLLAIHWGRKAVEGGATSFGKLVVWGGYVGLILSAFSLFVPA